MSLSIPPIPDGTSVSAAALLYAAAGWYVGPYDAQKAKNPGGLLGTGWHKQTSRDPAVIQWWWATNPQADVFLHVGRSGAVVFDIDHPENVRADSELGQALAVHHGPVQLTRDERRAAPLGGNGPLIYRAHYLYQQPAGRDIGNSRGLTHSRGIQSYGEVRGRNGVIVVAPSVHVHHGHGGIYRWLRTGQLPILPPALAAQLRDAAPEVDPASIARMHQLRGSVTGSTDPSLLVRGPVVIWNDAVGSGQSRHDALTSALPFAYREALAGLYPMEYAEGELRRMFVEAVMRPDLGSGSVRSEDEANREFDAVAVWALGQAEAADPAEVKAAALQRTHTERLTVFDPGPVDASFPGPVAQNGHVPVLGADPFGGPGRPAPPLVRPSAPAAVGVSALAPGMMRLTPASSMQMRAQRWLWWDKDTGSKWVPLGGIVLLAGRESLGKSTLATRIGAQITKGMLPGNFYGTPKSVVVCAGEDAWEQTILPRFVAAGADLSRVFRVDVGLGEGNVRGLELPTDQRALQDACQYNDVALVIADPLMGVVSGKLDTHKDAEVRRALGPLRDVAEAANVTVLGLIHVSKSKDEDLLTRVMASRAFTAVSRAVLFCARQEEDKPDEDQDDFGTPTEPEPETFLFGQVKSNLGPKVRGTHRYRIEQVTVGHDHELEMVVETSRIVDVDILDERINEIVSSQEAGKGRKRASPKTDAAVTWLHSLLSAQGDLPWKAVLAASAGQFSPDTLYKAKERGGFTDTVKDGMSVWSLPKPYIHPS